MTTNLKDENESLSRREREKLAHRQEIMDAATRIFAKKGFLHATLEDIAREAEFSKGTIYLYFASKEDLLYSILNEKSMSILHVMKETLYGEKSFKEELYRFFLGSAEVAFKEKDFFTFLMS
ncbi:TetR/AcrR family transcriptional regulator, partial [Candidatus Latescibacterota bacterium]